MDRKSVKDLLIPIAQPFYPLPPCAWSSVCLPQAGCRIRFHLVAETLLTLRMLYPNACIRLQPVETYYMKDYATAENDSSEMGHILFGLANVSVNDYVLNYGRARKGFPEGYIGPLR